jgi:hypothetical protein
MRTDDGRYTFMAAPALLLLAGCFGKPAATDLLPAVAVAQPPASASTVTVTACTEAGADAKEPKIREAVCLKELKTLASRKGDVLSLKIDSGTAKTFRTDTKGCDTAVPGKCEEYRLVGLYPAYAPAGAYILMEQGFESYGFKLVNVHTGETKDVAGVPRLAPDHSTYFVKSCPDGCTVGVASMFSPGPSMWEKSFPDPEADWEFVRWIDNDQVALRI